MLTELLRAVVGEARCRAFDWRHGVHTCGDARLEQLTIVGANMNEAVPYHPSHPKFLFRVLRTLNIDYARYTFIDLGSGKGRVLLIASEFPFREVIGVEFARELHDVACRNIRRYRSASQRCRQIQSLHADALDFEFPLVPLVVYLFNPFRPSVLVPVLQNLQKSLNATPREAVLVYLAPFHGELVERETILRCVDRSRYHITYRVPS